MEAAPEDAALGSLGLAGICRETFRVIRSNPPGFPFLCGMVITLSLYLLGHVAVSRALFSDASGAGLVRLAANWIPFFLAEAAFLCTIFFHWLGTAAFCVLSVAPRYAGFAADSDRSVLRGDSCLAARLVRTGPAVLARVGATSRDAALLLLGYTALSGAAAVLIHLPRTALMLLGGPAYLAGAAHIGAVWHVTCVMSVLEDGARGFRAMHASDELLTGGGKFLAAAAVFTTVDGCVLAVQLAFGALVVDNRMGLGVWLRVAVGAVMAVALWTSVVAGLVAQVVVYFVCKSYRSMTEIPTDVGRKGGATRNRKRQ